MSKQNIKIPVAFYPPSVSNQPRRADHKNNSPKQKAAWLENRKLGSRFIKNISPADYAPQPKEPSRRDARRLKAKLRYISVEAYRAQDLAARRAAGLPGFPPLLIVKQTVYRLAKVARRIPNLRRRLMQALTKKRSKDNALTPTQVTNLRARMGGCEVVAGILKFAMRERNIGGTAKRDATPHALRARRACLAACSLQPDFPASTPLT